MVGRFQIHLLRQFAQRLNHAQTHIIRGSWKCRGRGGEISYRSLGACLMAIRLPLGNLPHQYSRLLFDRRYLRVVNQGIPLRRNPPDADHWLLWRIHHLLHLCNREYRSDQERPCRTGLGLYFCQCNSGDWRRHDRNELDRALVHSLHFENIAN